MLESLLEKVLPLDVLAPVILGLAAYALIVFFGLSPVVAERMANLTYHPACVAWVDKLDRKRIVARETERRQIELRRERIRAAARAKIEAMKEEIERTRRLAERAIPGPLRNLMRQLHGGDIIDQAFSQVPVPRLPTEAELNLPRLPELLPPPDPAVQGDKCGCVVQAALSETKVDFSIFVGTLRAFTPQRIANLEDRMKDIAATPLCRAGKEASQWLKGMTLPISSSALTPCPSARSAPGTVLSRSWKSR